ncbi:hypothetical protein BGAL_0092g00040 [Botrytis galanthina]|uniref:Uncharacterized protein n=1 Tax=Botrytis galanthina TaxID=278940 RepID=A0A4S8R4I2_9HELO|nr:hypothetical protein BGAL_0092g00040 [Botrytis galanthina]
MGVDSKNSLVLASFYASALNFVSLKLTTSSALQFLFLNLQLPQSNGKFYQASTWSEETEAAIMSLITSTSPIHLVIDPEGDLTIRLVEKHCSYTIRGKRSTTITVLATYLVSRKVLSTSSDEYEASIRRDSRGSFESVLEVQDGSVRSLELWFRILHGATSEEIEHLQDLAIVDIWEALHVCQCRDLDINELKPWFNEWMKKKDFKQLTENEMDELMTPCYMLDHARAFAWITKKKVYDSENHIHESNPSRHSYLHLPHNVIGAMNAARGSLRGELIRGLFDPLEEFTKCECACSARSLMSYVTAITKTGIWPLQACWKKSVQDILNSPGLKKFSPKVPKGSCRKCITLLQTKSAQKIATKVQFAFHGLCLDCMDASKVTTRTNGNPRRANEDEDGAGMSTSDQAYWEHDRMGEWSLDCRISHGQPTWYFSFMGRPSAMILYRKKMKEEKSE